MGTILAFVSAVAYATFRFLDSQEVVGRVDPSTGAITQLAVSDSGNSIAASGSLLALRGSTGITVVDVTTNTRRELRAQAIGDAELDIDNGWLWWNVSDDLFVSTVNDDLLAPLGRYTVPRAECPYGPNAIVADDSEAWIVCKTLSPSVILRVVAQQAGSDVRQIGAAIQSSDPSWDEYLQVTVDDEAWAWSSSGPRIWRIDKETNVAEIFHEWDDEVHVWDVAADPDGLWALTSEGLWRWTADAMWRRAELDALGRGGLLGTYGNRTWVLSSASSSGRGDMLWQVGSETLAIERTVQLPPPGVVTDFFAVTGDGGFWYNLP